MTTHPDLTPPAIMALAEATTEAGLDDTRAFALAKALRNLKGVSPDDIVKAVAALADSTKRNALLGYDGIARGAREPGFSKRGTFDPSKIPRH